MYLTYKIYFKVITKSLFLFFLGISKSKTEADKQLMESQIKELETLSKSKDQEIKYVCKIS